MFTIIAVVVVIVLVDVRRITPESTMTELAIRPTLDVSFIKIMV